jgi:ribonuclease R
LFKRANPLKKKNDRPEGEVIRDYRTPLARAGGRYSSHPSLCLFDPDSKKIYEDICIPRTEVMGANHADKVIVEVTRWASPGKKAEGRVIKVLRKSGGK